MFNQPLDPKTQANKTKLKACIICIDQASQEIASPLPSSTASYFAGAKPFPKQASAICQDLHASSSDVRTSTNRDQALVTSSNVSPAKNRPVPRRLDTLPPCQLKHRNIPSLKLAVLLFMATSQALISTFYLPFHPLTHTICTRVPSPTRVHPSRP